MIIGLITGVICLMYMDPTLAVTLTDLGLKEANVGIAFAAMGFSFAIGSPVAGWLCKVSSKRIVIQSGLFCLAGSSLLVGPSLLLNIPNKIWIIFLGCSLNSFFGAFMFVPVIPKIVEVIIEEKMVVWCNQLKEAGIYDED